jgi:hypothetical protein
MRVTEVGMTMEWETLEQVARALGQRWARKVRMDGWVKNAVPKHWPRTMDDARRLVEETFGARFEREGRESIAQMLDRSARAAWRQMLDRSARPAYPPSTGASANANLGAQRTDTLPRVSREPDQRTLTRGAAEVRSKQ